MASGMFATEGVVEVNDEVVSTVVTDVVESSVTAFVTAKEDFVVRRGVAVVVAPKGDFVVGCPVHTEREGQPKCKPCSLTNTCL